MPCPIGGPSIRVLSPELQVLHLAVHAVKHAFGRWIWLVDLSRALEAVDLDGLLAACERLAAGEVGGKQMVVPSRTSQ